MYKKIHLNQCGYLPYSEKKATFRTDSAPMFNVCKSDGTAVLSGTADVSVSNKASGETVFVVDFSSVTEPGRYYISSDTCGESDTFEICENRYGDLFDASVRFFYLQRCGCDLKPEYAGLYAHPACHTGIGSVKPFVMPKLPPFVQNGKDFTYTPAFENDTAYDNTTLEVSGGWHDAGDYGRYISPAAMTVAQLLLAYEYNPKLCNSYHLDRSGSVSENGALPDYLAEVKYELDWMLKLQRPDGAVYHKATCGSFCGFILPQEEKEEIFLSPVSLTATADFAAVTAMAVRFYAPYDSAYAKKLGDAARLAYESSQKMNPASSFINPAGINTGWYSDRNNEDERYWAAAELYRAFGDASYHEDFQALASRGILHGYGWTDMGSYGNLAYLATEYPTESVLKDKIKASMLSLADAKKAVCLAEGYGCSLQVDEYVWGSNLAVSNNGIILYDAYRMTGDSSYLHAAEAQLSYLLGRNPMDVCYVTGFGTNPVKHPHHRPSGFLGKAAPGMLSGGPCRWRSDPLAKSLLPEDIAPAKAFVDMTGSFSTNEIAIYWNSAFVLLLALCCRE